MTKIYDIDQKLHELNVLPLLFQVRKRAHLPQSGIQAEVVRYTSEHPGVGLNELRDNIPALNMPGPEGYELARQLVVRLADAGVLDVCGEVPLEEVDLRYERVLACDLCGSPADSHPVVLWKHNTPVVKCTSCGLLYANPRWKAEHLFGHYTTDYWQGYTEKIAHSRTNIEAIQERERAYFEIIKPVYSNGRLLDIGCATGEFLATARQYGWQPYGVETSPISARIAQDTSGGEIHVGTLDTAPWEDGYFDVITLFDVIEHLQSPRAYIEKIACLLRPGGMFELNTPNINSLAFRLRGKHWGAIGPNDHLYYYSPRTLEKLLLDCGFGIYYMRADAIEADEWSRLLRFRALRPLARVLPKLGAPIVNRFMVGDAVYVVARRL